MDLNLYRLRSAETVLGESLLIRLAIGLAMLASLIRGADVHAAPGDVSPAMISFLKGDAFHNVGPADVVTGRRYSIDPVPMTHLEFSVEHDVMWAYRTHREWFENPERRSPFGFLLNFSDYVPANIRDAFVFRKNGKTYVRYPLSPDDTYFAPKIRQYLTSIGVPFQEVKGYFHARRTASRSLIVTIPTGHSFSLKPSTNRTSQGDNAMQVRPYPARWASLNVQLSDYFHAMRPHLKYLDVAWEAGAMGFPPVANMGERHGGGDMAMSIRLMESVAANQEIQYSGFVFGDRPFAEKLARDAGMTYDAFWQEAFAVYGRAMAENAAVLGFVSTSNHEQNFRWVLDAKTKRVTRVAILDLSDGHPVRQIFEANGQAELLKDWERFGVEVPENKVVNNRLEAAWYFDSIKVQKKFESAFFRGFDERICQLTNLTGDRFKWKSVVYSDGTRYWFTAQFRTEENLLRTLTWRASCEQLAGQVGAE